ncbi:ATP-binding protein, partial [Acidobacteriota bacterium]
VQVLRKDVDLNKEQKKLMDIVVNESQRVSQAFEHFITLASPNKTVFSSINLTRLMEETLTLLRSSGELPENIKVGGNYSHSERTYYGNSSQFKQIYWNVIKNAVKAMPQGGGLTIDFNITRKKNAVLKFSDTGVGMDEKMQKKIFEPFQSGFEDGQGIGLSVVRRIIDDYGGTISVFSRPEEGTEISISLPRQPYKK